MKTFKLPKEFAEKWLEALRSGEYKQTSDTLVLEEDTKDYAYCCLGVAGRICDLTIEQMNGIGAFDDITTDLLDKIPEELHNCTPTEDLASVLMYLNDGFSLYNHKHILINFPNLILRRIPSDDEENIHYSFKEIADFIEDNCEFYEN